MNRVILMGNICADPEMRTTNSGKSAATTKTRTANTNPIS